MRRSDNPVAPVLSSTRVCIFSAFGAGNENRPPPIRWGAAYVTDMAVYRMASMSGVFSTIRPMGLDSELADISTALWHATCVHDDRIKNSSGHADSIHNR